jgi:hypothetical protein
MKNTILIVILFLGHFIAFGQLNEIIVEKIKINDLPIEIKLKGDIIEALTWNDSNGQNIFISYSIGPIIREQEYGEPYVSKEIYAEQYLKNNDSTKLLWDILDFKRDCQMHVEVDFIPNSTSITDLDNNGISETTIAYKIACRSDVSLADFKVLMHENSNKYGLRGHTLIRAWKPYTNMDLSNYEFNLEKALINKEYTDDFSKYNGRYSNTNDFKNTPDQFLEFAIEFWKKYVEEKY